MQVKLFMLRLVMLRFNIKHVAAGLMLFAAAFVGLVQPARAVQGAGDALGFADSLFAEQDYFRAVTEYKRFIYHNPEHAMIPHACLNIARSYMAAERWEDARAALHQVLAHASDTGLAMQANLLLAEIPYLQGDYAASFASLQQIQALHVAPEIAQRIHELELWNLLQGQRYAQARTLLTTHDGAISLYPNLADVDRLEHLPRKSPELAGALSALLPGAGQLYNGRYREAGMAFALNAAFIVGGIQAIDSGNSVLGGILLFFEAGWYGGNIYNAMNSAHKTNRDRHMHVLRQLRDKYQFSLLNDDKRTLLQVHGRF